MKRLIYAAGPLGLALLVIGAGWAVLAPRIAPLTYQFLIVAGALLAGVGLWGGRELLFDRTSGKRARFGAGFLVSAGIGLMLLLLVNFISARYHQRWDLTRAKVYSLHPATVRALGKIGKDVDVYAFFPERNQIEFRAVKRLYETFAFHQPHLQLTIADPNKRPDLLAKVGVKGNRITVVVSGDRINYFPGYGEDKLLAALLDVARGKPKVVYWIIGHDERSVEKTGGEGYLRLQTELTKNFYQLRTVSIGPGEDLPEDVSLIVLADPKTALSEREVEVFDAYLRRGGRVLALADVDFDQKEGQPGPMTALLEKWGMRPLPALVMDARPDKLADYPDPLTVLADQFGLHESVDGLRGKRILFSVARPIEFFQVMSDQQIFHHVLVRGSRGTYVEPDLSQGKDFKGVNKEQFQKWLNSPPVLAVAAFRQYMNEADPDGLGREARLVVVGDADFLKDENFDAVANSELAMNILRWLTGEEVLIRKQGEASVAKLAMKIEPDQRRLVRMVVIIQALAIFLLGWVVWFVRRTR